MSVFLIYHLNWQQTPICEAQGTQKGGAKGSHHYPSASAPQSLTSELEGSLCNQAHDEVGQPFCKLRSRRGEARCSLHLQHRKKGNNDGRKKNWKMEAEQAGQSRQGGQKSWKKLTEIICSSPSELQEPGLGGPATVLCVLYFSFPEHTTEEHCS